MIILILCIIGWVSCCVLSYYVARFYWRRPYHAWDNTLKRLDWEQREHRAFMVISVFGPIILLSTLLAAWIDAPKKDKPKSFAEALEDTRHE